MKDTSTLQIALIQTDLVWENPEQNRILLAQKINTLNPEIDLIVLPEMFTSGFTMNAKKIAETMDGLTVSWMQALAKQKNTAITGSIVIKEKPFDSSQENNYFNRLLFIHPSGKIEYYNKKHTFTLAKEHEVYTAGKEKLLVEYRGWKICPLVCYDLRFPVWARNRENYDVLLYVASWPKARISAWDALLKARAIENMSYSIGVNRIGIDANDYEYTGNSAAYDMLGNCLAIKDNGEEAIIVIELEKEKLYNTRKKLRFLNDRDQFRLL